MVKCGLVTIILVLRMVLVTRVVLGAPTIRMQMCGSELANTLAQICSYGYHDPFSQTRRLNSPGDNATPNRLRVRRGVADECCKTGCTLDTMEQYCSAPLTPAQRARFLQQYQDNAMNRILEEVSSGSGNPSSLNAGSKIPSTFKEPKNDLSSKVRRQQDKKGQRGNNRCRCRRRRRRGKVDSEEIERQQNHIAPVIGTINPSYFGIPVILPPRLRKQEIQQEEHRK